MSNESSPNQAQQVCTSCKARKKKCDRALPKCSLCSNWIHKTGNRKNLKCEYFMRPEQTRNSASSSVTVSDRLWYSFSVDDDDRADPHSIDFPTMLFLDPGILQHGQIEVSRATTPIPAHIQNLLGDMNEIRVTISKFFGHIHLWMPFISKKRFYEIYLRSSFQSRPDVVLLLLSLKLITTSPPTNPRNPRTPLYYAVKHFYLEVEGSSIFSIPVVQAGVLLALYELGHAIYPAAFLSIGACARYAYALGINVSRTLNTRRVLTLVEVEERRRVWWAIVILDRFVSIGCPGRPFATADPRLDDLLPSDDTAWDQGIVRPDDSFTLSPPMTAHMSKFALLCQAARLLGQVLHHVSSDTAMHDNVWMQLDRTLQSMLTTSLNVESPGHDQIAFVYSTIVALYAPWLYSDSSSKFDTDRERSQCAKFIIQQITEGITTNLVEGQCLLGRDPEDMSPWGLFFAYHICVFHMRSIRQETSESDSSIEVLKSLRETFLAIDVRWNVAGVYLQLLEAQEVINNFS